MRKVWIEVALNGAWSRALQPGIPDTVDSIIYEGIACARRRRDNCPCACLRQWRDADLRLAGLCAHHRRHSGQGGRSRYPSYPATLLAKADSNSPGMDASSRFARIEALAARGLLEFAVVDPGSVNFTVTATIAKAKPASTYLNSESDIRHALDFAARHDFHPAFAIYEPGFTRAGAALARAAGVEAPIYRFMSRRSSQWDFRRSRTRSTPIWPSSRMKLPRRRG